MKNLNLLFCASLFSVGAMAQNITPQILVGPDVLVEYQVVNISANGRWACGNVNDGEGRGFIWDIVNDEIIQVAPLGQSAPVLDVSNDGTLVGLFTTTEATENGASMEVGGYYKNGKWHYLPNCGIPNGISDNGKYITGVAVVDDSYHYHSAIWTLDGEMTLLGENHVSGGYDVNNEGTMVCGYAYHPEKNNRTPVLMKPDSMLLDYTNIGPFSVARAFSPDGNIVLADKVIYNIKENKTTRIDLGNVYAYEFYRATNAGNAVGHYSTGMYDHMHAAYIRDGKIVDLQKYLEDLGVDLTGWTLLQCTGITEDERTFAVNAYDKNNIPHPLIIRLDANLKNPAPTSVKATHLEGTDVCRLTWKAPLANVEGVKGYNLWRNGEKIANVAATEYCYYDRKVANGNYEYALTAVYADSESEKSESATVSVADFTARAPRQLNAVQTGVRDVRLFWNAPLVNRPALKYGLSNGNVASFGGGTYNFEQAVRFEAADLAVYGTKQITDVTFYPMTKQNRWTVNFYSAKDTTLFASRVLDDSHFVYGVENTIQLSEPVAIPEGEDIYVGILVDVTNYGGYSILGAIFNTCRAGYTDLLRRQGEETFMSLYENAMSDPDGAYEYPITFPIGVCFGDASQLGDKVNSYKVFVDNTEVGSTDLLRYRHNDLADGEHTFSVAAVYSNGIVTEPINVSLTIAENLAAYKKISNIALSSTDGKTLCASWETPLNDDETNIGYSSETNSGGLAPSEDSGYSALYAASYDKDKLGLYDGYQITHVRFFPTADAEFAIVIREDGKQIVWKELERGVDYTKGMWNTIKLDEPITVKSSSEYLLILDCYDVTPGSAPIGMDNLTPFQGESDLFSDDMGETFTSVSAMDNATREGNWMIGLVIRSTDSKPLPVEGYNVYVDRTLINESPLTETSITHEIGAGTHQIRVDVMYKGLDKSVQGQTLFIDLASGIEDMGANVITLATSETQITVVGGEVSSVKAYNVAGALVAQTVGATLDVAHLESGIYVLTAVVDGKEVQRKIQVK